MLEGNGGVEGRMGGTASWLSECQVSSHETLYLVIVSIYIYASCK